MIESEHSAPLVTTAASREGLFVAVRSTTGEVSVSGDSHFELGHPRTGLYAQWRWDGSSLTVEGDLFGFLPVFYAATADKLVVATRVSSIISAGVTPDLDAAALSTFYWFGQFVGDKTPFTNIRKLPPQGRLVWSRDTFSCSGDQPVPNEPALPVQQAREHFGELFGAAIGRTLDLCDDFVLPLTGGRDSRHILLETVRQGRPPRETITAEHFPVRANSDWKIASQLSASVDVPHRVLPTACDYVTAEYQKFSDLDWMSFEHVFAQPVLSHLRSNPTTILDGLAGDVLSAGLYLTEEKHHLFESGRYDDLACHLLNGDTRLNRQISPEWRQYFCYELAHEEVVRALKQQQGQPNPISAFYFFTRTRRNVSLAPMMLMRRHARQVFCPYIEPDVALFLLSQPASHFLDHSFHSRTIEERFAGMTDVPFESKAAPPSPGYNFMLRLVMSLSRIITRVGLGMASRRYFLPRITKLLLPHKHPIDGAYWLRPLLFLVSFSSYLRQIRNDP